MNALRTESPYKSRTGTSKGKWVLLLQYSYHSLLLPTGRAMTLLSILTKLLDEGRNLQWGWTLQKFTQLPVLSQCTGSVICPNSGYCVCLVVMDAKAARDRHHPQGAASSGEAGMLLLPFHDERLSALESSIPSMKQSQCAAPFRGSVYGARDDLGLMFAQKYRNPELRHSLFQPKLQWKVALWYYLHFRLNAASFFSIFNISPE